MSQSIYFCNVSIEGRLTGIEYSSFKRALLFFNYLGIVPHFITVKRSVNGYFFWEKIKERGLVPKDSLHINVYDDYMRVDLGVSLSPTRLHFSNVTQREKLSNEADRLTLGNNLQVIVTWRDIDKKQVYHVTYLNNKSVIRRDYFGQYGQLAITKYYSSEEKIVQEDLFEVTGVRTLTVNYDDEVKIKNILKYASDGIRVAYIFQNEDQLYLHWLKERQFSTGDLFLIDKNRVWGPALSEFRKCKNIVLVSTLHSSHLRNSYTPPLPNNLNFNYAPILQNKWMLDLLVILTEEQRKDIESHFKVNSCIAVIPHAKDPTPPIKNYQQRDQNMIVTIGRLSPEKQFDHTILIMEQVVKILPKKRLYIYGEGGQRKKLEKLIKEKGLEENVFLPGHISNVSEVLNRASLYLCTSKVEGFPLTLIESLAHGVPIISYDIKYGPASMIMDGENGFLVERNNVEEVVARIDHFYSTLNLPELMSRNAYKLSEKFNQKNIAQRWKSLLRGN